MYYEIHGEGEPLLLIMGIGGDGTAWDLQVQSLKEHFKVIIFDNRDVGRSTAENDPYSIKDMADDTVGLMDALGLENSHILGASMGGTIAQELILAYPERVHKLILACTLTHFGRFRVSPIHTWKWVRLNDPENEAFPLEMLSWGMTHEFLKNTQAVDDMLADFRNPPFPVPAEAYARQADALLAFDALDRLGVISTPTLVMVADQDILTPPWGSEELADAIPNAQLKVLSGGGHCFFWEIPEAFNQTVINFLSA